MLLIDSREDDKIFRIVERLKIPFEKITLPVGDFIIGNVICERKTYADFVQSIRSGHLQKQLLQMEQYEHPFLLISGRFEDIAFNPNIQGWTVDHHLGALISSSVRYKTRVIAFSNDTQLIKAIPKIVEKVNDNKQISIFDTELLRNKMTGDDYVMGLLMALPRVGLIRGQKLLEKHPNLKGALVNVVEIAKEIGLIKEAKK